LLIYLGQFIPLAADGRWICFCFEILEHLGNNGTRTMASMNWWVTSMASLHWLHWLDIRRAYGLLKY